MIAACPECETRYRLPTGTKRGSRATFRCSRCEHVFSIDEAVTGPIELGEGALVDDDPQDDSGVEEAELMGETDEAKPAKRKRAPKAAGAEQVSGPSAAQFGLRALFGVSLGYAVLAIYLYTHPQRLIATFGPLPIIGRYFADAQLGPGNIQLTEVKGEYRRVQGETPVFVISGVAINNAAVPVRALQIKGRVIGAREDSIVVFCGTQPHDIERYSIPELQMLQSLERPPTGWSLGPGQQTPFLVVFTSPPPALREFTAQVAGVQRTRIDDAQGA
jgi:predicted Zn finger-like uncharacterized protein